MIQEIRKTAADLFILLGPILFTLLIVGFIQVKRSSLEFSERFDQQSELIVAMVILSTMWCCVFDSWMNTRKRN